MPRWLEHLPGKCRNTEMCAGLEHDTLVLAKVSITRITLGYKFDNTEHLDQTAHGEGHVCLRWEMGCHYTDFTPAVASKALLQDHI